MSERTSFKAGDRVCIPETQTAGIILSIEGDHARVLYDHGPIREPKLSLLQPEKAL